MSYDTPLALGVIVAALLWWVASAVGKWRQKRRLMRLARQTPQVPAEPLVTHDDSFFWSEFDRLTAPLEEHPFNQEVD